MSDSIERWGEIEKLHLINSDDHGIHFDADTNFSHLLMGRESQVGGAEGGYILVRLDVDDCGYSVVHVDPPAGWWPVEGKSPLDCVDRAIEYLTALSTKLHQIEDLP